MSVALLAIGDELCRGETREGNGQALARALSRFGGALAEVRVIGDQGSAIAAALASLAGDHRLVVVCGGLGPTGDDISRDIIAEALGVALAEDAEAAATIAARCRARGREPTDLDLRQARCPAGARLIANPFGTAPGIAARWPGGAVVVALPGVPREFVGMVGLGLAAWLAEAGVDALAPEEASLAVFGVTESELADRLRRLPGAERLHVRSLPSMPVILLHISSADGRAHALASADRAAADLDWRCYGRSDLGFADWPHGPSLEVATLDAASEAGATVAVAESCTGGRVLAALTAVPGASAQVLGGVVAYDNAVKAAVLDVPASALAAHGAVSEATALAMASGVRRRLGADIAVATTGIAGPSGGSDDKPVGTLWLAVADARGAEARAHVLRGLDRERYQVIASHLALAALRNRLRGLPMP